MKKQVAYWFAAKRGGETRWRITDKLLYLWLFKKPKNPNRT